MGICVHYTIFSLSLSNNESAKLGCKDKSITEIAAEGRAYNFLGSPEITDDNTRTKKYRYDNTQIENLVKMDQIKQYSNNHLLPYY